MKKIAIIFFLISTACTSYGQHASRNAINDFMNQRFGMFIHWGPVTLRGTEIGWSRDKQVAKADYDSLYKEFNPVLFNADAWVKTAKDAGMKYLTITARHHDGFCLWPSKYTHYNIYNTPYKKDIVGALKKACDRQGIKFCIYYSILDWWHPDYPVHSAYNQKLDPASNMGNYIQYMKNQLKELIDNYNPYMLWFDGGWEQPWTDEIGKNIYSYLKSLNPNLIVNNRLGKEIAAVENKKIDQEKMVGDYDTPEQTVGRMNMNMPWESCFTICNQWSWKPNDTMKSLAECLSILSRTTGGNGNLLLNVGPMPDGRIEARQVARLKEIGTWIKQNEQAIYGTIGGPYSPTNNYAATRKDNKIFIHVIKTDTSTIQLKKIHEYNIIKSATMQGLPVKITSEKDQFKIHLPEQLYGKEEYIIVLEMDKPVKNIPII